MINIKTVIANKIKSEFEIPGKDFQVLNSNTQKHLSETQADIIISEIISSDISPDSISYESKFTNGDLRASTLKVVYTVSDIVYSFFILTDLE
jgi:hypothetical protein